MIPVQVMLLFTDGNKSNVLKFLMFQFIMQEENSRKGALCRSAALHVLRFIDLKHREEVMIII